MKDIRYDRYSSVDEGYCVYLVYGEDPNADMGGYHHSPFLGSVEGTFDQVLEYAADNMRGFYSWGSGGYIIPKTKLKENIEPIILNPAKKLKKERYKKLKKFVLNDIDALVENLNNMDKDTIKTTLIEIKKKIT